jgi:cell wall assembly regulator SMI1
VLEGLRPPASEADLLECERKLGMKLPADVRHAYLRHDGTVHPDGGSWMPEPLGLFGRQRWYSLEEVVDWYESMGSLFDPDDPYFDSESDWSASQPVRHWSGVPPQWIPIAQALRFPVFTCLDMAPGPGGHVGQMIVYTSACGTETCRLVAHGFSRYLDQLARALEAGTVRPAVVQDGVMTVWLNVTTQADFALPERQLAYGLP